MSATSIEEIQGFTFPFQVDAAGRTSTSFGAEKLKQNILHILRTELGDRVMQRKYGGGIRSFVHELMHDAVFALLRRQVATAITKYEPRVILHDVLLDTASATSPVGSPGPGQVTLTIVYMIKQSREVVRVSVPLLAENTTL